MCVEFVQVDLGREDIVGGEQYASRQEAKRIIARDPKSFFPHAEPDQEIFVLDDGGDKYTLQSITGDTVTDIRFEDNTPVTRFIGPLAKVQMLHEIA